jgi:hypothetical protein
MSLGHLRPRLRRLGFVLALAAGVAIRAQPAHADDLVELTKTLSSSSDKARLSAVTALARLGDKRTLKPLVTAMHDPNNQVRAIAATALGKLGHKAALPTLRETAANDPDDNVRERSRIAAIAVAKANNIADDSAPAAVAVAAPEAKPRHAGFGHQAHAVENHPDCMIVINSSTDDSPGRLDKLARRAHSDALRAEVTAELKASPSVTFAAADAQKWGLDARHLDLSIVKMEVAQNGTYMEIEAQLRLAISDDKGRMMSFVSGGAKVQIPKKTFDLRYLPALRKEAVENAMRGMFDKLLLQLRNRSQS